MASLALSRPMTSSNLKLTVSNTFQVFGCFCHQRYFKCSTKNTLQSLNFNFHPKPQHPNMLKNAVMVEIGRKFIKLGTLRSTVFPVHLALRPSCLTSTVAFNSACRSNLDVWIRWLVSCVVGIAPYYWSKLPTTPAILQAILPAFAIWLVSTKTKAIQKPWINNRQITIIFESLGFFGSAWRFPSAFCWGHLAFSRLQFRQVFFLFLGGLASNTNSWCFSSCPFGWFCPT